MTAALGGLAGPVSAAAPLTLATCSQQVMEIKFDPGNAERPGICIEVLNAMARHDPALRFKGLEDILPLRRIENSLHDGTLDFFMALVRSPEREDYLGFIDKPYIFAAHHTVALRRDDPVEPRSLDDIRALGEDGVIVVTRGSADSRYLLQQPGLHVDDQGTNLEQNLRRVAAGRARFFYNSSATLHHYIEKLHLEAQLRVAMAVFRSELQLVAYRKSLAATAVARLGSALEAVERSGELAQIRSRYALD
ncbi:MAG: transporter substrate-binding domain-containing protein [Paucibacter sp.]|nr:transporter substrate-binding domain-containing protein [Roseateles sp.]